MAAYYNEFDPGAAAWLRELIKRGLIADGEVDERSILDVRPVDLAGFKQCHFFAGIGGWSYALRLAGWPDDRAVWTGSPPCQPFSTAGRRDGRDDARHLAPHFVALVGACRPSVLFGEQVASADVFGGVAKGAGRKADVAPQWAWFDDLSDRLEAAHYAVGASDIPAAGVGAFHIRQRTFFGAVRLSNALRSGQPGSGIVGRSGNPETEADREVNRTVDAGRGGGMADACGDGCGQGWERVASIERDGSIRNGADGGLANAERFEREECVSRPGKGDCEKGRRPAVEPSGFCGAGWPNATNGPWATADWLFCRDGKWRAVEPGTSPLAHGVSARVGRLRGYGNAIVPQVAAVFIEAFSEVIGG